MSAKWILGAMVAGTAAVLLITPRREAPRPAARPVLRAHERPWLTREAASQIVGDGGTLGPLFAGVTLGGPAPSAATRARIAEFARANALAINFEVVDDELAAIRLVVTFGGCCGYEGADGLARRFARPQTQDCCGCTSDWVDDWSVATSDGVQVRGHVQVNRVEIRWEPSATFPELLARADSLLGQDRDRVRARAGDRFGPLDFDQRYRLEVPFPFASTSWGFGQVKLHDRDDLGLKLEVAGGRIATVSFVVHDVWPGDGFDDAVRARWGRPRRSGDDQEILTWRTRDRVVTATPDRGAVIFMIRAAGAVASR